MASFFEVRKKDIIKSPVNALKKLKNIGVK
jgi:hypothetical protein